MARQDLTTLLCDLIALDYDAIEAYDAAIKRIDKDETSRSELGTFRADHDRHIRDLSPLVRNMGGTPPTGGDFMRYLTQGKVILASIVGDVAILKAMKSNEDTTNQKYGEAVAEPGLPSEVRLVLERNLADERRHRAWIEARIATLGGQWRRAAA